MFDIYGGFVLIVFSLTFNNAVSQCNIAEVCEGEVPDNFCPPGQVVGPNASIFGCCPGCITPSNDPSLPQQGCQAPYSCLPDGRYAPVQCKGDIFQGRCFCYDESGKRIFGQMWRNEAVEMTCACSRRRAELESSGKVSTLHCTPSGDYEPLQCDDGLCWCAEPKTGQPTASPVPEVDMKRLPCYSVAQIGENYLRRCESTVYAIAMIQKEQSEHGTVFLGNPTTFCDYDGSYGPYQINNGIVYCTGTDGQNLGSWQTISSEMSGMNCNCARDTAVYFPAKGMTVTEICQGNGNYQPNQNVGDVYYCVDSDGYPTTGMLPEWPAGNCVVSNPINVNR